MICPFSRVWLSLVERMVWDHEAAGSNPVTRTDWFSQSMLVFYMQAPISLGAYLTTSEGAETMRSEFDERVNALKKARAEQEIPHSKS